MKTDIINQVHTRDYSNLRNNLKKMTVKVFVKQFVSYLIGLAIISFVYPFIDHGFSFNIGFVISGAIIFASIRALDFYLSGDGAISSEEVADILKDIM